MSSETLWFYVGMAVFWAVAIVPVILIAVLYLILPDDL